MTSMEIRIGLAQINPVVGDLAGNAAQLLQAARGAYAAGARLLLAPELALSGYPAEDLLLRPCFVADCEAALHELARQTAALDGLHLIVGHPQALPTSPGQMGGDPGSATGSDCAASLRCPCRNALSVLSGGVVRASYAKRELPNYQVFDEQRTFVAGTDPGLYELALPDGSVLRLGLLICEDAWFPASAQALQAAGAELLLVSNASPFHAGKAAVREQTMRARVQETGLPLLYAQAVGGQDEIVFDGGSFALHADGSLAARAQRFAPELLLLQAQRSAQGWTLQAPGAPANAPEPLAELWHALVLALRDYVGKNGFPGALLGLSGGVDSALVLALAVDALGPERVDAVMLPSPYTADISRLDAIELARRLGVRLHEIPIEPACAALEAALAPLLAGCARDSTEENIQARVRGTLLMALSNKFGTIVLSTGNKSELATGYCTLYGDMAGGYALIKDLLKTQVYALAHWRNAHDPYGSGANPIPLRILTREPSAELRPNQTDQDSLPPYELLDAIIVRHVEHDQGAAELIAAGFEPALVEQVLRLIRVNEYKRRQAPVGPRLTPRSFGKDWRMPNTNRYRG